MRAIKLIWALAVFTRVFLINCQSKSAKTYGPYVDSPKTFARISKNEYNAMRENYLRIEEQRTVGSDLHMTNDEIKANKVIMKAKTAEYEEGLKSPRLFTPSKHVFEVLDKIKQSKLFKIISEMPKGGVLHAHDTALCSTEFVVGLTRRDNLWMCNANEKDIDVVGLRFSKSKPSIKLDKACSWELLSDARKKNSAKIDEHFRERLTLYPKTTYPDNNAVWMDFFGIFSLLDGLLFYAPVWGDYYYNALKEFQADGVQYLEFRTTLPILYDLDNKKYTALDTVRIYDETLKKFMKANPDFIGSKLIYAPLRFGDDKVFDGYVKTMKEITEKYPNFVAGFDLVGQEENGRTLKEYAPQIIAMPSSTNFYFHAGETNWFGSSIDENLIDAVILGTKRIGHGFAIIKHPVVLDLIKQNNIAVELNPLSNQVLQLVADLRNHPGAFLFSDNYPVVVSSDDPSFWKATPLSHDFYVAFLGIASAHSDLRLLKKLILNSLQYSGMSPQHKAEALGKWQVKWDAFIKKIANY